jgi:hypothetical protein
LALTRPYRTFHSNSANWHQLEVEYYTKVPREAEDEVRRHVGCARAAARKLVRRVLTDAAIRGDLPSIIVWESLVEGPPVGDLPPFSAEYWRTVRIRGAKVYDPYGNCWRTLWMRQEAILDYLLQTGAAAGRVSESAASERRRSRFPTQT